MDIAELIEKGKIKRYFTTKHKYIYPGGFYHVTQRAPGLERLFLEEDDYLFMLHLIKEKTQKFGVDVYAFVLMPNHLHLELKINESNLSETMKNIFETYAMNFNKKYQRKGHVFCGRYRAALCFDEIYLIVISLYIHLNPYIAGLSDDPRKYRWSSCNLYTNWRSNKSFVKCEYLLNLLHEDVREAKRKYYELLVEGMKVKIKGSFKESEKVFSFRKTLSKRIREIGQIKNWSSYLGSDGLEEEIERFRTARRVSKPEDLKARRYLIQQLLSRGFSIAEISEQLKITRRSIYRIINVTKQDSPVL